MFALLFLACAPRGLDRVAVGAFRISTSEEGLNLETADGRPLARGVRFDAGRGDEVVEMQAGSYRLVSGATAWDTLAMTDADADADLVRLELVRAGNGDDAAPAGTVVLSAAGDLLRVDVHLEGDANRVRWRAACTGDDRFAGLGSHAFDVEHGGEAFPLWTSEPGIGHTDTEVAADDWFLRGTRHSTSLPSPFLVRPEPMGLVGVTEARVEVDLCTDGESWSMAPWEGTTTWLVIAEDTPLAVVGRQARAWGPLPAPPDWALAPWNDAVRGSARVREVAETLRAAGAPSGVIWTEDWKGGVDGITGYRLSTEWDLDAGLYPDAAALDGALEAAGFKWFAYFAPFLTEGTRAWNEAADYAVRNADGAPYTFTGVTLEPTTVLDLTRADARAWARSKMDAALAIGFDGWMADYGEWVPPDASLDGADAVDAHNAYPGWWQETNAAALADADATMFTRSGWSGGWTLSPIHWPGDQRTSFDADDGLPTVVPLMIGAGMAGWGLMGSDVAGYQSIGNPPSTRELWFRWASLGAFSPILRTHHGAFEEENWQFDRDAGTLAHWTTAARTHMALVPYISGLVRVWQETGAPLVRAPFLQYPDEPWDRTDAYMLGPALLVAPVVEQGATARQVDLPAATAWYDWFTGTPVVSGRFSAALDEIPVFAPAGAVVPLYDVVPDTLVEGPIAGLVTRTDAEKSRLIRVFPGARGGFVERDGTRYESDGAASAPGRITRTLSSGEIEVNGLHLRVTGAVERTYTVEVVGD